MASARSHRRRAVTKAPTRPGGPDDVQLGTTLDEVVDLVAARLPRGLIDAASAARIRASVDRVPAELVARFGLECDLSGAAADADVLFAADSETGGMQMLADPSCSFGLRLSGLPEAARRPLEVLVRALELGFEALRGTPLDRPALTSMRAVVRQLPDTARVDRAGLTAGLPDDVRLWLARLLPEQIGDLVEATRDRDEARQIRHLLDEPSLRAGGIGARIDIGDGVDRAIGLICTVDAAGSPAQVAARWRPLLDRLVAAGLCTAGKRDALLGCHGLLRERPSERWPEHLTRLSKLFGDGTQSVLEWRVHHICIECDRGEPVHATATIAAAHGWSRR
jgi:hypothetical protein